MNFWIPVVLALLTAPAAAQELWAMGSPNYDGSSNLYRIEFGPNGPYAVDLGETGAQITDMCVDPTSGRVFGVDLLNLLELEPVSLGVRVIGRIGGVQAVLTADQQGWLYGWGGGPSQEGFYRIDKATGWGTRIGNVGMVGGQLAFDHSGRLFGIAGSVLAHQLVEIDPNTGTPTVIGPLAATFLRGLVFLPNGRLLVSSFDSIYNGLPIQLYEADPNTAALTWIGVIANSETLGLSGLAWRTDWLEPIAPTPGVAGVPNAFSVTGLLASERGWLMAARVGGATPVPGCALMHVGLHNPHVLGSALASVTGVATLSASIPPQLSQRTVNFQWVARATCRLSRLLSFSFP